MKDLNIKTIARIESDFPEKFGIPRQSGLLRTLKSVIRFEPEFRNADALRGLEGFSHLWILWIFSENVRDSWKPATRSSFRPNPIAMSCVKIEEIRTEGKNGPEIVVSGADLMDGTPIVDIKPYLPYTDSIADATSGFAIGEPERSLHVEITAEQLSAFPQAKREALVDLLAQDPRPHYQDDPERTYGFAFAGKEIKFKVAGDTLTVIQVV